MGMSVTREWAELVLNQTRQRHDMARCGYGTIERALHGDGRAFDCCPAPECIKARKSFYEAGNQAVVPLDAPHAPTEAEWADLGRPEEPDNDTEMLRYAALSDKHGM